MSRAASIAKIACLLCVILLFSACSSKARLVADANSDLVNHRAIYQLTLQQDKAKRSLLVLEHKEQDVSLIGISHAGMTLFVLQRSPQGEKLKKMPFTKIDYSPSELLNALLIAQYDTEYLQRAMPKNWQITVQNGARIVRENNKQIIRIEQIGDKSYQVFALEQPMQLQLLSQEPIQ